MRFKTKIRPSDRLWTEYIRLRDKGICFKCGKTIKNKRNSGVSHFRGRRKESVRFDDDNCDLMCTIPCHQNWEHEKKIEGISGAEYDGEYTIKKKAQLGEKRFNLLLVRERNIKKRDDEMDKLVIEAKIDILKNNC